MPRGKAYLYDTRAKVPLIVHFPEKHKHLSKTARPSTNENLVGFVDFAPTLFNSLDIEIPGFMMGRPFLGNNLPEPKSDPYEIKNLINSITHQNKISEMKSKLIHFMKEKKDLGLHLWSTRRKDEKTSFYKYVRNTEQPIHKVIDAAAFSSTAKASNIKELTAILNSNEPAIRYWQLLVYFNF